MINKTPLHYAAENNSKEMLELLILNEAEMNTKDINEQTTIIIFKLQ